MNIIFHFIDLQNPIWLIESDARKNALREDVAKLRERMIMAAWAVAGTKERGRVFNDVPIIETFIEKDCMNLKKIFCMQREAHIY